jgi:hypothetical protein
VPGCFERLFPAVLGEPCRQGAQRRETPGVDVIRGVEQLSRAAGVLDRLPLIALADAVLYALRAKPEARM